MTNQPVRLAVVGAGPWGRNIIRTIASVPGAQLCRLVTSQDRGSLDIAEDCIISTDWRELLSASDIDGIALAVPTPTQVEIAEQLIDAGIATFLEKPMALDAGSATALRDGARTRNVPVLVDHIYLFHPAYHALRDACGDSQGIRHIESIGGNRGPFRTTIPPVWDWGPHDISMCLDLVGEYPQTIVARTSQPDLPVGAGANFEVRMKFPSGTTSRSAFGNRMPSRIRRLEVSMPDEKILFDDSSPHPLQRITDAVSVPLPHAKTPPLNNAVARFCKAIESRDNCTDELELAVNVVRVLEEVQAQVMRHAS